MTTKAHHHRTHSGTNNGTKEFADLKAELATLKKNIADGVHTLGDNGARLSRSAKTAARATVGHLAEDGAKRMQAATESARGAIAERPFTSVSIAAGVGAVFAASYMLFRRRG